MFNRLQYAQLTSRELSDGISLRDLQANHRGSCKYLFCFFASSQLLEMADDDAGQSRSCNSFKGINSQEQFVHEEDMATCHLIRDVN